MTESSSALHPPHARYVVPQGWVETYTADNGFRRHTLFHLDDTCDRIRNPDRLKPVARPGAAARCRGCARPD